MKLVSFLCAGRRSWGVLEDDAVLDVGAVLGERFDTVRALLAAQAYADVDQVRGRAPRRALGEISWLPPIPDPAKVICIGLNYETHRVETGRDKTGNPAIFTRFADSQIGHLEPIVRPHVSTMLDYEGELAIVIGKAGRYVDAADAMGHVAGYACYNDGTVRDWQRHTTQFAPGKNFPATGGFGPCMVTADEIPDYTLLRISTRVNDTVVQDAGLDQLIFPIPELIAYCSAFTPLAPGDVIATGTPGGVGFKREPQLFLKPGDRVEVHIPGVGLLVNFVEDEAR
jgi:2-keto-4-pentenoate hydratase/2-oxohepta-3-ene-1,7-dioic acid hydratase in catechol pathway